MKKIITILMLVVFASVYSYGQSQRLVLAEEFTQASCGPCAAANPTFNALLQANPTKITAIKYQTNWPGVDPMNTQTQTWVGPRVSRYNAIALDRLSGNPTIPGARRSSASICTHW